MTAPRFTPRERLTAAKMNLLSDGIDGRVPASVSFSGNTITETTDGATVTTTVSGNTVTAVYGAPVNETWVTTIGASISTVRTSP